jgi:hypothetical protein
MRYRLVPPSDQWPGGYGFVEWSRRYTNETVLTGGRIFTGLTLQH